MGHETCASRVFGVIPAAGLGRRMGMPKQVLAFGRGTMSMAVAQTALRAGVDGVVVVTRTELVEALRMPVDGRLLIAINDNDQSQMIDSIRIGWKTVRDAFYPQAQDGLLVVPADMPQLAIATCRMCIDSFRQSPGQIVVAAHRGRRGHPLILPWMIARQVGTTECGLDALVRSHGSLIRQVEVGGEALEDVDTWADYRRMIATLNIEANAGGR